MVRAVRILEYGEPEGLRWMEVAAPEPAAGEVCIDVHAAGVNYPDLLVVRGKYQILPPLPFSPGKEIAGTISAIGAGVTGFAIGDRVLAEVENGGYAEQVVAPAGPCCALPDGMDFADAIGVGLTFQTAHFALFERGHLKPGETVLVTGATGGVGVASLQVAKAYGARVIAGIATPGKAEFARANGADAVVDLRAPDLVDTLRARIAEMTEGRGADVIVENVGGTVFDACLRSLAWSGRVVVVGFASGAASSIRSNYLLIKNTTATGLHWSDYRERAPELVRAVQQEIFARWREGAVRSTVTAAYPLEEAALALRKMANRDMLGKTVLLTERYRGRLRTTG
jgi:NADPH2:quinone reductase